MVSLCSSWCKCHEMVGICVGQSNMTWIWRDRSREMSFPRVGGRREPG